MMIGRWVPMKQKAASTPVLPAVDRKPLIAKASLAAVFLLGAVLVFMGIRAQKEYQVSGFSSESAYGAIHALTGDIAALWQDSVMPLADTLPENEREVFHAAVRRLLLSAWESQSEGSAARLEALLTESKNPHDAAGRLLCVTYLVNGPKIGTANRKELTAPRDDLPSFRLQLLRAAALSGAPVPAEAEGVIAGLEGEARGAMLMQAFLVSSGSAESTVTEHANALKKSVRGKSEQLTAFRMIALKESRPLWQLILSNSRAVILTGVILMLDMLLLGALMLAEKTWTLDFKWILVLLIVDFLLYFQLLPSVFLAVKAFTPGGVFSLETIHRLIAEPMNREALANTLIASFATMVFGTLLAFPLAFLVGRTNLYCRKFFRTVFVITYMVPPYVGAMAWLRLMNPNVGTINQWLRILLQLPDEPGPLNVYSLPGMIWTLTTFYYPYAFITISRAMEKMDPSLEEAGRISGANPLKTLFTVTLPLMMPSLCAGALLVFVSAASCYGIPSIIGIPGNVNTVTTRIVEYVSLDQQSLNDATGLAVFLMAVALLILFLSDVVLARRQYITVSGKSVRPATVDLGFLRVPLTAAVFLFTAFVILLPFLTILLTSFKTDVGKSVTAQGNFTLSNWITVFSRTETLNCLKNSLLFAAVAATLGLVIACVMSYLLQRTRLRGRSIPNFLITLGSGTPSVVIALGLIMTMRGNFGLNIYNTAYILIIAYLIKYLMMGMRTVVSAMSQIHVSLEESSQVSGASWLKTMFRVTVPLIFPSIAAGWFLIFIPSFYELSMTALLYSSTTKTIGFQLFEYWTFTSQPMSCAMAFGILLIVIVLNLLLNRITKGKFSI